MQTRNRVVNINVIQELAGPDVVDAGAGEKKKPQQRAQSSAYLRHRAGGNTDETPPLRKELFFFKWSQAENRRNIITITKIRPPPAHTDTRYTTRM